MRTGILLANRRCKLLAAAALACVSFAGCGRKNLPVEPDLAAQSLEAALASWQRGEPLASLDQRTPPITVGDFAWRDGRKLSGYRLLGEAKNDGFNLRYDVELTFADAQGAAVEQVSYIVGTSPAITIFRE